jgi:hypothetical protein
MRFAGTLASRPLHFSKEDSRTVALWLRVYGTVTNEHCYADALTRGFSGVLSPRIAEHGWRVS